MTAPPFGSLLRTLRERAGLSQEELAGLAALSTHAVSALERGTRTRPYPHTVRSLADALEASEEERAALIAAVPARRRDNSQTPGDAPTAPRRWRLPEPATTLLGRESDVARVIDLLRGERIVTLTGTGGVGKTRLGLAVARAAAGHFLDGVCFVELAPVLDPTMVLPAIADAVQADPPTGGDQVGAVAAALQDRQLLLVLDNLEHLLDAAPHVASLVRTAPGLTVLVTSRAPLRVRGESEVVVEPLALPGQRRESQDHADGEASHPASLQLLLERAGAVSPGWGTAPAEAAAVRAICLRLAGVPLALELAAARARLHDPAGLLERLDEAVDAGPRDLPDRQRTMRSTLDWSYGLLTSGEQGLLRLVSSFVDGFRLDDLEAVADAAGHGTAETLARLSSLVEHSLVTSDPGSGSGSGSARRFRLLEPILHYARERLVEAGEAEASYAAHLTHFLALAEEAAPHYQDGEQVAWLARIDAEHANLSAAAERALAVGDHAPVARLCWALWMYWWMRGHHAHGRRLAEASLRGDVPADVRPRAELGAATMSFAMDDIEASRSWWLRAEEHARGGTDPLTLANSIAGVGLADLAVGDVTAAWERFSGAVPLAESAGATGEWLAALVRIWMGTVALVQGDPDSAVASINAGLASARRRGDRLSIYIALYNLTQVEVTRHGYDEARRHLDEGMRLSVETGDLANMAYFLEALAVLETAESSHARVPLLLGAAQAIREHVGARGYHYYRPDPEAVSAAVNEARGRLGADRYDDALDLGRGLRPDQAVDLALGTRRTGG